ncbi:MAG: aldo/keto reductase [Chloroflexi bacterium]|nr:aldo/keto reductase [Chloroflexota bacterium]
MRYRQLGTTDLRLSEVSLGTVALGIPYGVGAEAPGADGVPPPADRDAIALVHHAIDRGLNFFDTARAYGRSEKLLGKALRGQRHKILLATKVSCQDDDGKDFRGRDLADKMAASLHTSLRLLGTEYVDLLLLHSASTELLDSGAAIAQLKRFQADGKTRYIGASTYGTVAPRIAIAQGVDALQVAFNILDQRLAAEVLPAADAAGVGIIARSVFLKGALSSRAEYLPARLSALKRQSRAVEQAAAALSPPLTREAAALKFVLAHESIATALVGVRDIAELEASLAAARAPGFCEATLERFRQLRCDEDELLDPSTWGLP